MKLEVLTIDQCEQVRIWRNNEMECWRTPFMLTREMQEDFYKSCCDKNSPHRYWAIIGTKDESKTVFLGIGGITYIEWENRIGQIMLIIDPEKRGKGNGKKAVNLILNEAFNNLNLKTVYGECYDSNKKGSDFWQEIIAKYNGYSTTLPNRKYWNGEYHNSLYFSIDKEKFN